MKKIFIKNLLLCTLFTLLFFTMNVSNISASIKINKTHKTMYIGKTYTLKVNGTKKYIMWKSSNKKVVKVSSKGKLTAKSKGKATITAIIGSGQKNKKLKCKVVVKPRLSCKKQIIRCYPDEYQTATVSAKALSITEDLYLSSVTSNNVISFDWDPNSYSNKIIFMPKKIGMDKIKVTLNASKGKNEFLIFTVFSYPDKTGWISANKLSKYGLTYRVDDTGFYVGQIDENSLLGIVDYCRLSPNDYNSAYDVKTSSLENILMKQ